MKEIYLGGKHGSIVGNYTMVDDADFEWLDQWKWYAHKAGSTIYARRDHRQGDKIVKLLMHRVILGVSDRDVCCDHINGNGLLNTRDNIRPCSHLENMRNRGKNKIGTSIYKGVSRSKRSNKWLSQIWINGTAKYVGLFDTEIGAASAYNSAAKKEYGAFCRTNKL